MLFLYVSVTKSTLDDFASLLHLESYLEKGQKFGNCHQLCLLMFHLLVLLAVNMPQDYVKPSLSEFLKACHQLAHAKQGNGLRIEYDNQ